MPTLKSRLLGNFGAGTYSLGITIIIQLGSIPLFLYYWGNVAYGEWLVLSAAASYLSLTDIGFSKVAGNRMAMLASAKDYAGAKTILHSAWAFVLIMSILVGVISSAVISQMPLKHWLNLTMTESAETKAIVILLIVYSLLCIQGELFGAIYRSADRIVRGIVLLSTLRLIDFIITVIFISINHSPLNLSIALVCSRICGYSFILFDSSSITSQIRLGWQQASLIEIKKMVKPSLAFMCMPLGHSIPSQGMTLIINSILGPSAVVVFNSVRILTRIIIQGMNLIKAAVWPEISHLIAIGDLSRAKAMHRLTVQSTIVCVLLGSFVLLFLGKPVIQLWTHQSVDVDLLTLGIFVIGVILNSIWLSSAVVLEATNQHVGLAYRYLAASFGSLVLALFLVPIMNISGAVVALIAVDCFLIPYVLKSSCLILKDSPWSLFARHSPLSKICPSST
jgi:O-antigen/teichoic acid export membrane protein